MALSGNTVAQVLVVAGMLAGVPVMGLAQAVTQDEVIAELQKEGFMVVDTGATLLGRLRITALGPEGTREVVLNPRNGKILRDVMIEAAPDKPLDVAVTAKVAPVVTETLPGDGLPQAEVPDPAPAASSVALPEVAAPAAHSHLIEQTAE